MHPVRRAEVLLHEILHGCWAVANLPCENFSEEEAVNGLGLVLLGVIIENPHILEWINAQYEAES